MIYKVDYYMPALLIAKYYLIIIISTGFGLMFYYETTNVSQEFGKDPYNIWQYPSAKLVAGSLVLLFYAVALVLIAKRCILRIYYNEAAQKFTFVNLHPVNPHRVQIIETKAGKNIQLIPDDYKGFDPLWSALLYNSKILIDADRFSNKSYFNVLFGFSEPDSIIKLSGDKNISEYYERKDRKNKS